MSARLFAMLRCDHEGCWHIFEWSDESTTWKPPRLTDARRAARPQGWRTGIRIRTGGGPAQTVDFCGVHNADIEAEGLAEVVP